MRVKHWPGGTIGRHSLSHALWACQLPQRGSRGGAVPFIRVLANIRGCGRFSSPLRNSEYFYRLRATKYTPSVSHSLDSSLREGAGNGCGGRYHSTGYLRNRGVAGDFHRPYENSEIFTFHRSMKCFRNRKVCKKTARPGGLGGGLGWGGNQKLDLMVEIRMSPATTRSSGAKLCWKLSE